MQLAGLAEWQSRGDDWLSVGTRVLYGFTDLISLALEVGADVAFPDDEHASRVLAKGTLALELKNGRAFYDRPALRAFVTSATWNQAAGGQGSHRRRSATLI